MEFNQDQKKIIESIKGAYLINAPVGTGKTTVLAQRVVRALESGIKPEEILCLTFTNRAAGEMSERIKKRIKNRAVYENILVKTFHGFCAFFARSEAKRLGLYPDFTVFDEEEQIELLEKVFSKYPEYFPNGNNPRRQVRELADRIYNLRLDLFAESIGWQRVGKKENQGLLTAGDEYRQELMGQNALDFNELVLTALRGLYLDRELKNKWSKRFKLIQLDEFQDTHISEYLVVKQLARRCKNIAFIGDLDQTIYGWRGSEPEFIAGQFKKHFTPVQELKLSVNYRFSAGMLDAVRSYLKNLAMSHTKEIKISTDSSSGGGKAIDVFRAYNFEEELDWVIDTIKAIKSEERDGKIAVLARSNFPIAEAAKIFEKKSIPHITVDKYDFFRRQEIRDLLAYLKIIFNRYDLDSAYRIALRPGKNIGLSTLNEIREQGNSAGLKLSDFLSLRNYAQAEPFENLIKAYGGGRLVVFDTETTGTNPFKDEVVQIYALELVNGKAGKDFHCYIRNAKPVGITYDIHGLTDEFLQANGRPADQALDELKNFIGGDIVVGHNVNFDIAMLAENGRRNGILFDFKEAYDTLDLARRLLRSENYKLSTLAEKFGLSGATHSADDDVRATAGLLEILLQKLDEYAPIRRELFGKHSKKFIRLGTLVENWQKIISQQRPPDALQLVWEESGLKEYYLKDKDFERRLKSVESLADFFRKNDDTARRPDESLRELLQYTALAKNIDILGIEKGSVPIVTVHQVKGLEFDYIFVIGLNEFSFPNYRSDLEEEKRLFYVALTRARKKAFVSYSSFDKYGRPIAKSRFIDYIDGEYINLIE